MDGDESIDGDALDFDEQLEYDYQSELDSSLDEDDRMLQKMILRNFMARQKVSQLE